MRFTNGATAAYIHFVALSTSDHVSRVTGLTSFNVYAAATSASTGSTYGVSVNEVNSTQMPGVYRLLLSDSTLMTVGSGFDNREIAIHITSSMDPVTRVFEVYRRDVTTGVTLAVNSSGEAATSLGTLLSSVNAKVTSVDSRLSSMDTMLSSVNSKVTSVDTKVSSMNTQVTSILANVTSIDSRLTSMDTMLSSVNAKVTSVDTDIDTALTRLSSLGTHVDTLLTRTSPNNIGAAVWDAQTTAYRVLGSFGQVHYVEMRGAAADVTSNSITMDSSASTVDGHYSNAMVMVGSSADHVAQLRRITDHTSLVLTVSPAWSPTPSTPISYFIQPLAPDTTAGGGALTTADIENIVHGVWDEQVSSHNTAGTFGGMVTSVNSKVSSVDSRLSSMDTMLSSVNSKVTSVDTKVSSINTQVTSILANVTSIDSRLTSMDTMLSSVNAKVTSADSNIALVKAETTAIKAKTDSLAFTQAGKVDANIHYVNNVQVQGTGTTVDTWRPV